MEITSIPAFLDYYGKIRERTLRVVHCIPLDKEKFDWTYQDRKFTFADLIRHIATIERYMYAENVQRKPSIYPGHGKELADGPENVMSFMDRLHRESIEIFSRLTAEDLKKKCLTPAGIPITISKWLRALVEHEIHHRGQIYIYLGILGIETPPIYGLTSEEVFLKSRA
ncbi:MAG TPA: DinB family protein [Candidatus Angelobacter sp.]|nr:DinB family protein [Candidatus Angelobacter sp.]